MILEPIRKKRAGEDDSFVGIRVGVLLMVAFALFGVLAFRLWYLQVLSGDQYVAKAMNNQTREVNVEAPRGVIYDRNGKILVENRAGLDVGLLPMDMYNPDTKKGQPEKFKKEIADLSKVLGVSEIELLVAYEKAKKNPYTTYTVKEDVPEETTVAYIKEHSLDFPGVEIETSYLRQYPLGALATHVLGYVGEASQSDLDQVQFSSLRSGSTVGKDGVERKYDKYLRGVDGHKTVVVDAAGRPKGVQDYVTPTAGSNLWLTIDSDLQAAAENALIEGIQRAHDIPDSKGNLFNKAAGGAVVAINPQNGQILAMASYPDYDPSLWVGGMSLSKYNELREKEAHFPLFDRALDGLYPAGSTFKPFVAATALNAGLITQDTVFNCTGSFSLPGVSWDCWIGPRGHGEVSLLKAIAQSCDVYFYNLGNLLYQQPNSVLQNGVAQFGFGQQTGVDLPGETSGSRVPGKFNKPGNDPVWRSGDEVNLAIGQGDLLVTPLQMAVGLSAIANSTPTSPGTIWVPHVGWQIRDSSNNTLDEIEPEKRSQLTISNDTIELVREGMRLVVSDPNGTAHDPFKGFPITVAGKTGTSQKLPEDDYALFMGYAPADPGATPEIAVVAIIEQGGHGSSVAAPVVRRVMEAYFHTQSSGSISATVTE
jgi:penicillin-binding protein 2